MSIAKRCREAGFTRVQTGMALILEQENGRESAEAYIAYVIAHHQTCDDPDDDLVDGDDE